jgi:hypothetical protein
MLTRQHPYRINNPVDGDEVIGIIVRVIANYSESLSDQANLGSLSAQEVLAHQIFLALDKGKWFK